MSGQHAVVTDSGDVGRARGAPPAPPGRALSSALYDVVGHVLGLMTVPVLPFLLLTRFGRGLGERLGRVPAAARGLRRPIWVHAASVGEVLSAEPLIRELRRQWSGVPIVVSTTSVTGRETARTRLAVEAVMLLPVDIGWIVDRAVRALRPRCLIIVETEIWPALLRSAARHGAPPMIVSGRISERAAARYAWIRWLTRPVLSYVAAFAMQTDADAARIAALGAAPERVQVLGSLKFARGVAAAVVPDAAGRALIGQRPLLVAASTHADEEAFVLDACTDLWIEYPQLLLLIAPRRPERFDDVARLLGRAGIRYERRSRVTGRVDPTLQVLLLDTIGELPNVLPVATAVFVGGTVAAIGGHNVLEPALFGKPVAFGPHTANVQAAAEALLRGGAATRVSTSAGLYQEWRGLLTEPELAKRVGARARAVIAAHAAVAERTVEAVRRCTDGE